MQSFIIPRTRIGYIRYQCLVLLQEIFKTMFSGNGYRYDPFNAIFEPRLQLSCLGKAATLPTFLQLNSNKHKNTGIRNAATHIISSQPLAVKRLRNDHNYM